MATRDVDPDPHQGISPPVWSAERLGRRLRELRTERGLRLSDVARKSKLSISFISHVEQGQSDIGVGRLMRIAHALDVHLPELVDLTGPPPQSHVRAGQRAGLPTPMAGVRMELLADSPHAGRTYAVSHLAPGSVIEALGDRPPGQEYFIYILEGAAAVDLAGAGLATLGEGDSAAFTSEDFRSLANACDTTTRLIWASIQG